MSKVIKFDSGYNTVQGMNSLGTAGNTITSSGSNFHYSATCNVSNCHLCYQPYTYYPYTTITYTSPEKVDMTIRKVENGYILKKDGKEFVITDKKDLLKHIE